MYVHIRWPEVSFSILVLFRWGQSKLYCNEGNAFTFIPCARTIVAFQHTNNAISYLYRDKREWVTLAILLQFASHNLHQPIGRMHVSWHICLSYLQGHQGLLTITWPEHTMQLLQTMIPYVYRDRIKCRDCNVCTYSSPFTFPNTNSYGA